MTISPERALAEQRAEEFQSLEIEHMRERAEAKHMQRVYSGHPAYTPDLDASEWRIIEKVICACMKDNDEAEVGRVVLEAYRKAAERAAKEFASEQIERGVEYE